MFLRINRLRSRNQIDLEPPNPIDLESISILGVEDRGKDCHSLATSIGVGLDLRPILPSVNPRVERVLQLSSLITKSDLILVMSFLKRVRWQEILPQRQRTISLLRPPDPDPPPQHTLAILGKKNTLLFLLFLSFSGTSIFWHGFNA